MGIIILDLASQEKSCKSQHSMISENLDVVVFGPSEQKKLEIFNAWGRRVCSIVHEEEHMGHHGAASIQMDFPKMRLDEWLVRNWQEFTMLRPGKLHGEILPPCNHFNVIYMDEFVQELSCNQTHWNDVLAWLFPLCMYAHA